MRAYRVQLEPSVTEFLQSGLIVVVGTRDAALRPEIARAAGVRVSDDGRTVDLLVGRAVSGATLPNLRDNGRLAVTVGCAATYRSLQLKGRCVEVAPPTDDDLEAVDRQRRALGRALARVGIPPDFTGRPRPEDLVRVRFTPEELFDQTPGPRAGERL